MTDLNSSSTVPGEDIGKLIISDGHENSVILDMKWSFSIWSRDTIKGTLDDFVKSCGLESKFGLNTALESENLRI